MSINEGDIEAQGTADPVETAAPTTAVAAQTTRGTARSQANVELNAGPEVALPRIDGWDPVRSM